MYIDKKTYLIINCIAIINNVSFGRVEKYYYHKNICSVKCR